MLAATAGAAWTIGVALDADIFGARGLRVPLPTYPWERKYYWVEPDPDFVGFDSAPQRHGPRGVDVWFTVPVWRQLSPPRSSTPLGRCLVFADPAADGLVAALEAAGDEPVVVRRGNSFGPPQDNGHSGYSVRPAEHRLARHNTGSVGKQLPLVFGQQRYPISDQ